MSYIARLTSTVDNEIKNINRKHVSELWDPDNYGKFLRCALRNAL